ncbi:MAG: hypothetical protein HQL80_00560 [Magnetococcales bacterium]|nr:hypothetical protein [Magnetococcales bacterium]
MNLINLIEYPNVFSVEITPELLKRTAASGTLPLGQYAVAWQEGDLVYLARDPIGCNKLFYAQSGCGNLYVANQIARILEFDLDITEIHSVPPGYLVGVDDSAIRILGGSDLTELESNEFIQLTSIREEIALELESFFSHLAQAYLGYTFVVCLSGGLDSSIIAFYAAKYLKASAAVFTYASDEAMSAWVNGEDVTIFPSTSEDFKHGVAVAKALNMSLLPVLRSPSCVMSRIVDVLRLGQDYRDFNVHCASVNLFLAEAIRSRYHGRQVVVLTGDLMNEYLCDYHSEEVDGTIYYPQPRMPLSRRRRFYVRGLDAGDREIGVFSAFGLTLIQPFARLARHYLQIPPQLLDKSDAKWIINGDLLPEEVSVLVGRVKCRAQVAGQDKGTLGIYHKFGLTQEYLLKTWAKSIGLGQRVDDLRKLIEFGRYRQLSDMRR